MKQFIVFVLSLIPVVAFACEWRVKVVNLATQEIKYYKADSAEPTPIVIERSPDELFAMCQAYKFEEDIDEADKKVLQKVENGVLSCAYAGAPRYPISAQATRFVYIDGPDKKNRVTVGLADVPDTGSEKIKTLFSVRYQCRSDY